MALQNELNAGDYVLVNRSLNMRTLKLRVERLTRPYPASEFPNAWLTAENKLAWGDTPVSYGAIVRKIKKKE